MTDSAQPEGRRECWFGPCEHGSYCERHDHHSVTDPFGQSFGRIAAQPPAVTRPGTDERYLRLSEVCPNCGATA